MGNVLALGYSGPPMRRPVASNEVRWLACALVRASDAANAALGLDQPPRAGRAAARRCSPGRAGSSLMRAVAAWRSRFLRSAGGRCVKHSALCSLDVPQSCPGNAATCLSPCMQHCEGITGTRAVVSGHAHAALPLSVFTMCCVWVQQAKAYLRRRGASTCATPGASAWPSCRRCAARPAPGAAVADVEVPSACLGGHHPSA